MLLLNFLFGGSLLIWGRKLFWLFIGAAGFFTGWQIAQAITKIEIVGIVVGLVFALAGFFLARFVKTIAIGVAGFLMGGAILHGLSAFVGLDQGLIGWVIYLVGGVGGVVLIGMFFDWTLIALSSLGGATFILQGLSWTGGRLVEIVLFLALLIFGVVFQSRQLAHDKKN